MIPTERADEPIAEREVVITRVFDAPAHLLFEAYSTREHLMKWFGPKGWPLTHCELNFRIGGRFRFAMTGPSGVQDPPFGGEYREIVPNRKIVFDDGYEIPGADLFRIENGRIKEIRVFYDTLGLMQQLGVAPAPGLVTT